MQPAAQNTVVPGDEVLLSPLAFGVSPEGEPPARPPEALPAPDPNSFVNVNLVAALPGEIGDNPAPRLADPAKPLPDDAMVDDQQTVDLRGPAPQVGFKLREAWRTECRRIDKFTNSLGQVVPVTGYILGDFENLYTVEEMANQEVINYQTKVIKGETTFSYADPSGRRHKEDRLDALAGEVVMSKKFGHMWRRTLLEAEPSI
jgi:hypothetical protein